MTTKKQNVRRRSFTTKNQALDPIVIEINGEEFSAHPRIPGMVLLDFINAGTDGAAIAGELKGFLKRAFPETEQVRLEKTLYDSVKIVDEEMIGEIVSGLIEEYASRPTLESEQSSETS